MSAHVIWRHALRAAGQAIIRLQHIEERRWQLTTRQGEKMTAELSGQSIINPNSALLIFGHFGLKQQYRVIIPSDSLPRVKLRQLKALLLATKFK